MVLRTASATQKISLTNFGSFRVVSPFLSKRRPPDRADFICRTKKAFPDVSEITLRTDLKSLDGEGQIIRIHGSARSIQTLAGSDGSLSRRALCNPSAKRTLAEKAAELAVLTKPEVYLIGERLDRGSLSLVGSRGAIILFWRADGKGPPRAGFFISAGVRPGPCRFLCGSLPSQTQAPDCRRRAGFRSRSGRS